MAERIDIENMSDAEKIRLGNELLRERALLADDQDRGGINPQEADVRTGEVFSEGESPAAGQGTSLSEEEMNFDPDNPQGPPANTTAAKEYEKDVTSETIPTTEEDDNDAVVLDPIVITPTERDQQPREVPTEEPSETITAETPREAVTAEEVEEEDTDIPVEEVAGAEPEDPEAVGDEPVDIEATTPDVDLGGTTRDLDNLRLTQAAIIQNYLDGTPLIEAYYQHRGVRDKSSLLETFVQSKKDTDLQVIRDMFLESPLVSQDDIVNEAQIAAIMETEVEEKAARPERVSLTYEDALTQGRLDEATSMQIATNAQLYEDYVLPMQEDMGWWETGKELAKAVFAPWNMLLDNEQVTEQYFGANEELAQYAQNFQAMSPERKRRTFPDFKEHIEKEVGKTKAVEIYLGMLNPAATSEDFDSFSSEWAAVSAAETATIALPLISKIGSLQRANSAVRALRDAERAGDAADINTVVAISGRADEEVANATGVDLFTAHNNSLPFSVGRIDPAYTSGLSKATQDRIAEFQLRSEATRNRIVTGESWRKEHAPLSEDQQVNIATDTVSRMDGYENVQIFDRTKEGFTLRADVVDADGNLIRRERKQFKYNKEEDGQWEDFDRGTASVRTESPLSMARGKALRKDVERALHLDTQSAAVSRQLQGLQREALRPILGGTLSAPARNPWVPFIGARQSLKKLDDVLQEGNNASRNFSDLELRRKGLNEQEIEAYYNVRSIYDSLYDLRNFEARRDLVREGYQNITLTDGADVIGQKYATSGSARQAVAQLDRRYVHIDDANNPRTLRIGDEVDIEEMYNQGWVMSRSRDPVEVSGNQGKVNLVMTKPDQVSPLPQQVINYREGYVPRIYTRGAYFVKAVRPSVVDGRALDMTNPKQAIANGADASTVRQFDNRREAEEFAETMRERAGAGARDARNKEEYVVLEDREIERTVSGVTTEAGVGPSGGLYTGARREEGPVPFGPEGTEAPTMSTFEALSKNIQNISNYVSRNEMRQHWRNKWVNAINTVSPQPVRGFGEIPSRLNPELQNYFSRLRDIIDDWSAVPTDSERFWEAAVQKMIDSSVLSGKLKPVRGALHNIKHKDPVAMARSAAFHSLLGWFNPVQMWVQAQALTVAASMNILRPDKLAKIMYQQTALAALDLADPSNYRAAVAKGLDADASEISKIQDLWKRTGYRDSILNTADHASAMQSYGVGADGLRRLADKGLIFYRAGELANRRVSFLTALDEFATRNKKNVADITDDDLGEIMTRANNFMLNMSRSNRAWWQRGVMSLPTQFLQVNAKLLESLVLNTNKTFTPLERVKILAGQGGLYGAAGVPFASLGVSAYNGFFGDETDGLNESDVDLGTKFWNGGIVDSIAYYGFGIDSDIARRSTVAEGIESFFFDLMEDPAAAIFNAPFFSTADRSYRAFKSFGHLISPALDKGEFPPPEVIGSMASQLGRVASSWDNVHKAWWMSELGVSRDSRGSPLVTRDFNTETIVMQAIGFAPEDANQTYELEAINRSRADYVRKKSDALVFLMSEYALAVGDTHPDDIDPELTKYYTDAIGTVKGTARNQDELQRMLRSLREKVANPQSRHERAVNRYVKGLADDASRSFWERWAEGKGRPFQTVVDENQQLEEEQ